MNGGSFQKELSVEEEAEEEEEVIHRDILMEILFEIKADRYKFKSKEKTKEGFMNGGTIQKELLEEKESITDKLIECLAKRVASQRKFHERLASPTYDEYNLSFQPSQHEEETIVDFINEDTFQEGEEVIAVLKNTMTEFIQNSNMRHQEMEAHVQNMVNRIDQLVDRLFDEMQGSLPSFTETDTINREASTLSSEEELPGEEDEETSIKEEKVEEFQKITEEDESETSIQEKEAEEEEEEEEEEEWTEMVKEELTE